MNLVNQRHIVLLFALFLVCLVLAALSFGPFQLNPLHLFYALSNTLSAADLSPNEQIMLHLRLPRVLSALSCGALLALSGALMQGLFRNPLADPGIIGVASGSAAGAALGIVFPSLLGLHLSLNENILSVSLLSFIGALISTFLVYRVATRHGHTSVLFMLLAGIAIAAMSGAFVSLLSYLSNNEQLRALSLWQMGSTSRSSWLAITLCMICLLGLSFFARNVAPTFDVLQLGEANAQLIGIDVQKLKRLSIVFCALSVALSVASCGLIGFVGLIVPHLLRLCFGPNHRLLFILAPMGGAALLILTDMLARSLIAPAELPIGVITAFIGAPILVLLLLKQQHQLAFDT